MTRAVRGTRLALLSLPVLLAACTASSGPSATPSTTGVPASPAANACSASGAAVTMPDGWPSSGTGDLVPFVVSSELVVGENRFLFTLVDDQNRLIASPDVEVELAFHDLSRPDMPVVETDAVYLETPDERGLYRAAVEFPCSGDWGAEVTARMPEPPDRSARVVFTVAPDGSSPAIGEAVPSVETPTADSAEAIASISTDEDPDPDLYTTSVAEALAAGEPFVVAFATPAFCQTRACGPALDVVKSVADEYEEEVTFIHVEPYELEVRDGQLQPVLATGPDGTPRMQTVPSVQAFGLRSEPFIFVVDADGRVVGRFEGLAGEDELREAIEAATG